MDYKQFNYILKIAEQKSISKAAEALYITQPALSHFVAKVEDELNIKIFNRATNPISLTPAGEYYVNTSRKILGLIETLSDDIAKFSS